jgi:hypothetical protein
MASVLYLHVPVLGRIIISLTSPRLYCSVNAEATKGDSVFVLWSVESLISSPRPLNAPSPFLNQRVVARHRYTQQPVKILQSLHSYGMVAQQVESRSQFFRSQESVSPFVCSGGNFALLVAEVIQLPSGSSGIWSLTAYLFTTFLPGIRGLGVSSPGGVPCLSGSAKLQPLILQIFLRDARVCFLWRCFISLSFLSWRAGAMVYEERPVSFCEAEGTMLLGEIPRT